MKRNLAKAIEDVMDRFLATATDDEFWSALEEAGWNEFSKIDMPVLDYHSKPTRYVVTAKQMLAPHGVPPMLCYVEVEETNNNELALAA
jgi:hypothetical protein